MQYERDNIKAMQGYTYGEQPEQSAVVKLNTNENPYPPSPAVQAALRTMDASLLRRYPAATANPLRDALAALHGLNREQVVLTHAGDEALRLAFTTFVSPQHTFGMTDPSYSLYPVLAAIADARIIAIDHEADWSLPLNLAEQWNAAGVRLACVVNPHAPSGVFYPTATLARLAAALDGVLLIDEAYADFVDPELAYNSTRLIDEFENVLVLRTFSKGYSLAGLRLGYLLGRESLIEPIISKTRDSYNVDSLSQRLGLAAIQDQTYARSTWHKVRAERERQTSELRKLGFSVNPSQGNFLLAEVPAPHAAVNLYEALKSENLLVRYFAHPRLRDSLRITIGTAEENTRLNAALGRLLGQRTD